MGLEDRDYRIEAIRKRFEAATPKARKPFRFPLPRTAEQAYFTLFLSCVSIAALIWFFV